MAKIDTILKGTGVAALLGLGIPVGLSEKFSDGQIRAEEIKKEFGITSWTFRVRRAHEFSKVKVELYSSKPDALLSGKPTELGKLEAALSESVKAGEIRIYAVGNSIRVLCNGERREFSIPFDPAQATIQHIGGKGREIAAGTFLLAEQKEASLIAVVSVE
jgi:hypothetical protein